MKIEKTIAVIMGIEDRQKMIDFYVLIDDWIKEIEETGAEDNNQLYKDLTEIARRLFNFVTDYT